MVPWSTSDLSDVTLVIKGLVDKAIQNAGPGAANIKTSCNSPEISRTAGSECHLTIYMLHIGRDPYWRNTPVAGGKPQLNKSQPLSLNLSYLLTAFCERDFVLEQRAMSIALQAFQSNPIMNQVTAPTDPMWSDLPGGEFVISIEADTIEEMSRLWQAFTVPIRLSALIKVSVVFIQPAAAAVVPYPAPSTANLSVGPENPGAVTPSLADGFAQILSPAPPNATPAQITAALTPLAGAAGASISIGGSGLDAAGTKLFLSAPGGAEWEVTPWITASSTGELDLLLPAAYAAQGSVAPWPNTVTPLPGAYSLSVTSGTVTSNAIPLVIAPAVSGLANPPLLKGAAGIYTIGGGGFVPAETTLTLGTTALTRGTVAPPGAGNYYVDPAGSFVSFALPTGTPTGYYPVLLAVNGIAASGGWVAVAP
jgi:hypothetical protein